MGNNIYETPRDMAKWNVKKDKKNMSKTPKKEDKNERLNALKARLQQKKK